MAPTKAQKRGAQEEKKPSGGKKAKTTKKTQQDPTMSAIEHAIEQAEGIPENCRLMLLSCILDGLSSPSDDRHKIQTAVVGMVDEVIGAGEARLQASLEEAKVAETGVKAATAELASKLADAEAVLADKILALEAKTLASTAASEKVDAATNLLSEKQAVQQTGDATMIEQQKDKAALEKGAEKDLKAILEGGGDCNDLLQLIQKLNFDESLVKALPSTCAKAPSDRGTFDTMVLNQLEANLKSTLATLSEAIEAQVPEAKERATAVDAAQGQLAEVKTVQECAAEEQSVAEAGKRDASSAVEVAKDALSANDPEVRKVERTLERAASALTNFQDNTRCPFEQLRDRKSNSHSEAPDASAKVVPMESDSAVPVTVGGA